MTEEGLLHQSLPVWSLGYFSDHSCPSFFCIVFLCVQLSYAEFQKYLDGINVKCDFVKTVVPQIKKLAADTIKAVSRKMDPHRRNCSFEIFGYDFMIDEDLKPWLIEVNTNPCLELASPYLARLIPAMLENAIK